MVERGSEQEGDAERSPVSEISDDLLVEIFSRVPYKSTCCCKCVSRRWRDLVSHPDHHKKMPQSTLAGFFFETYSSHHEISRRYQSVSGNWRPPINCSLSFLPSCERLDILDCCNGLLLCRRLCWMGRDSLILDYVVCNPTTEKWVAVPETNWSSRVWVTRLGFDPAVSSHFHVYEFIPESDYSLHIKGVGIYSSKAGVWMHQIALERLINLCSFSRSAFFRGMLYLSSRNDLVVAVDVEGKSRIISVPTPHNADAAHDIYLSQGKLCLANYDASELSVWALEDSSTGNWTLKHNVSRLQLFGKEYSLAHHYNVIIHPEDNVIILCTQLYIGHETLTKLMSYKMDSMELHFMFDLGCRCLTTCLSYVPSFLESLADGN